MTTLLGLFQWSKPEHTFTVHADGDLTISHRELGMVAVIARGQWVAVETGAQS